MLPERDEVEEVVESFLGGRPGADETARLRRALEERAEGMKAALARAGDAAERARTERELKTLARQIEALAREELIAEFVEDSVRATISSSHAKPEEREE
ncbi:MAG: hypothetical protein HY321_12290 [Armatimonadetes bacterium]|nr:hypothetical protein [Armatimonadota bacterium]